MIDLHISDLQSAVFALESWMDGPGAEPEHHEDAVRCLRALNAFNIIIEKATSTEPVRRQRHLRLVDVQEKKNDE